MAIDPDSGTTAAIIDIGKRVVEGGELTIDQYSALVGAIPGDVGRLLASGEINSSEMFSILAALESGARALRGNFTPAELLTWQDIDHRAVTLGVFLGTLGVASSFKEAKQDDV